ncbi:hypothetical protein EVA_00391 [gut metagenome]|uniref:Uncharacterized protein n=1 Tax=gut metagenome TaxID=749906 RepID=J9DD22_9ZZZZ
MRLYGLHLVLFIGKMREQINLFPLLFYNHTLKQQ